MIHTRSPHLFGKFAPYLIIPLSFALSSGLSPGELAASDSVHEGVHIAKAAPLNAPDVQEGIAQLKQFSMAFSAVSDAVKPTVVSIQVEKTGSAQAQMFGLPPGLFGGAPEQEVPIQSGGSGIVVSSDGMILTNNHVVEGADKIQVHFATGETYSATIRGTDPKTDLAVIEVDASNLPYATFGDSDSLRVGEWVIAIGHPYSLKYTVTAGIVSAKGRSNLRAGVTYQDFIQTDASINPGNSGGPLVNLDGEVIGINTLIDGRGAGLGFSIPSRMAAKVAQELIDNGKVIRPWLGVRIQDVDSVMAEALNLEKDGGAFVSKVESGSPAALAGVKQEDIILELDGTPVDSANDLVHAVISRDVGQTVHMAVFRNGRYKTLTMTTAAMPESGTAQASTPKGEVPGRLGLRLIPVSSDMAANVGLNEKGGLMVSEVSPTGLAARAGVIRGDVILEVNQEKVKSPRDLREKAEEEGTEALLLKVWRQGEFRYLAIDLG